MAFERRQQARMKCHKATASEEAARSLLLLTRVSVARVGLNQARLPL